MKHIAVLILSFSLLINACSKKYQDPPAKYKIDKNSIARFVPLESDIFLKFRSFEKFIKSMPGKKELEKIKGKSGLVSEMFSYLTLLKSEFGFDPYKLSTYSKIGINPKKEFAVSLDYLGFIDKNIKFSVLILLPVLDGKKFMTTVMAKSVKLKKDGEFTYFKMKNNLSGYISLHKNYLFISIGEKAKEQLVKALKPKNSIQNYEVYKTLVSQVDTKQDIFVYLNLQKIISAVFDKMKNIPQAIKGIPFNMQKQYSKILDTYRSTAFTVGISEKNLTFNGAAVLQKKSEMIKFLNNVGFNKKAVLSVKTEPVFFASLGFDVVSYIKTLFKNLPKKDKKQFQTIISGASIIQKQFGLDLEEDIINNIGGNFSFAMYNTEKTNTMDKLEKTLFTMSLKNGSKLEKAIKKLSLLYASGALKKETIDGKSAFVLKIEKTKIYFGINEKNLIIALNKKIFSQALSENLSDGFIKNIQNKSLIEGLKGKTSIFYMNFKHILKLIKSNKDSFKQIPENETFTRVLKKLEYLSFWTEAKGRFLFSKGIIKTRFDKPFFSGLLNLF